MLKKDKLYLVLYDLGGESVKKKLGLFVSIIFFIGFTASCSQKTNYATDGPFVVFTYSPAGPDEFRNMYSRNYALYENGKLILYTEPENKLKIGDNAPVSESQLTSDEVAEAKQLIEQNKFWKFKEDVSTESQDGVFLYLTVNLTDESKTVGGLNPSEPKFIEITDYISNLVTKEERKAWNKEIKDHIYKMNPE